MDSNVAPRRVAFIFYILAIAPAIAAARLGEMTPTLFADTNAVYRFALTYALIITLYASPFWVRLAAAVLLAAFADSSWTLAAGIVALAAAQASYLSARAGSRRPVTTYLGSWFCGLAMIDLQDRGFTFSALAVTVLIGAVAAVFFYRSLPKAPRRLGLGALLMALLALAGSAASYGLRASEHVEPLQQATVIDETNIGNQQSLERLQAATSTALADLDTDFHRPLAHLPVLSQNTVTANELLAATNAMANTTSEFLHGQSANDGEPADPVPSQLAFDNSGLDDSESNDRESNNGESNNTESNDVEPDDAEEDDICRSVANFQEIVQHASTRSYLAPQLRLQLDELDAKLSEVAPLGETCAAVRLLRDEIISGEPQTYLVMLMTTAEVRGVGGLITNWATVRFDNGSAEISDAGRAIPVNRLLEDINAQVTLPTDVQEMWGPYEFDRHFQDIGATPDGELVADTAIELFGQTMPATELSGVMILGPRALASLASLGGGPEVQGKRLDGAETVEFLTKDQYELDIPLAERVTLLDSLLHDAVGDLDFDVSNLSKANLDLFTESIAAGELIVVPRDATQRSLFRDAQMTSNLPHREAGQLFGIVEQNAGLDKLDPYLEREATLTWESATDLEPELTIRYTNTATPDLPEYVLGFSETPNATNRLRVAAYAPVEADSVTVTRPTAAPEDTFIYYGVEKGHAISLITTDIAPGESIDVTYHYSNWAPPQENLEILRPPSTQQRDLNVVISAKNWLLDTNKRLTTLTVN